MAIIPEINVKIQKHKNVNPTGMASKVAVIGAFETKETNPVVVENINDAYTLLGDDKAYKGVACIDKLFNGASSLLCVNTTTWSGETPNKEFNVSKLTEALAKIKGEDFDILFIAEALTDDVIPIITAFLDECFEMKAPVGLVGAVKRTNKNEYITTSGLLKSEHVYQIITQSFTVDEVEYSLEESSAYYCGIIAGLGVGNSMTMKELPNVNKVSPEYTFETGSDGKALIDNNYTIVKCQDRVNDKYVIVNSECPNGYDLYINRVRDYVIKQFNLTDFLGRINHKATINEIKQEASRVKNLCCNSLNLLEDIEYRVEKKTADCVEIYLDRMVFDGIITKINVYVNIEVQ